MMWGTSRIELIKAYTNTIYQPHGGTHVTGLRLALNQGDQELHKGIRKWQGWLSGPDRR